jgi:hypothetical protein
MVGICEIQCRCQAKIANWPRKPLQTGSDMPSQKSNYIKAGKRELPPTNNKPAL